MPGYAILRNEDKAKIDSLFMSDATPSLPPSARLSETKLLRPKTPSVTLQNVYRPPTGVTPDSGRLTFSGREGDDVTVFIAHVQEAAFAQGHQRDDEWCADYAATRLPGPAMRWYTGLDDDESGSWRRLRHAMVRDFPESSPPEPPAAVGPSPTAVPREVLATKRVENVISPNTLNQTSSLGGVRRGHIRVVDAVTGSDKGLLQRNFRRSSSGPQGARSTDDSLVVELPSQSGQASYPCKLKLVNKWAMLQSSYLGIRSHFHHPFIWTFWNSKGEELGGEGWALGESASEIWRVESEESHVSLTDAGGEKSMHCYINENTLGPVVLMQEKLDVLQHVKLLFDPIQSD